MILSLVQAVNMTNHQAPVNHVGSRAFVTVNNGSSDEDQARQPIRHVTVLAPTARVTLSPIILRKLLIKAVHKGEKDSGKIFTLRSINPACVSKLKDLKSSIKVQLSDDLVE